MLSVTGNLVAAQIHFPRDVSQAFSAVLPNYVKPDQILAALGLTIATGPEIRRSGPRKANHRRYRHLAGNRELKPFLAKVLDRGLVLDEGTRGTRPRQCTLTSRGFSLVATPLPEYEHGPGEIPAIPRPAMPQNAPVLLVFRPCDRDRLTDWNLVRKLDPKTPCRPVFDFNLLLY